MLKILFVEDDLVDQMAFLRMVKKQKLNYKLDIVDSVGLAADMLNQNSYDLVITDLNFPDGTAFDILEFTKNIPIIFVSGSNDKNIINKSKESGVNQFLIKDNQLEYLKSLPKIINKITTGNHKEDEHIGELAPVDEEKLINASEKELVNLSHIKNLFDNNKDMINEVISLFLKQNPKQLKQLKVAIENNDERQSNMIAHQIKSGYTMMGMRMQRDIAELIEKTSTEKNINFEYLHKLIAQLIDSSNKAYPILSNHL